MRIRATIIVAVLTVSFSTLSAAEPAKVRLFILSGQSNMVGLPPEISFTPGLKKAFPGDEIIVVKDATGGQPISRWYKKWQPPEGPAPAKCGDLYDRLLDKVRAAVKDKKLDSVSFVWMQGERDAKAGFAPVYAASLKGLVAQLRADLKRDDLTVVVGRLSDNLKNDKGWDAVRAAQVQVAEADPFAAWVDTDDLNGPKDGLHYDKQGYAELGKRFAEKTIALLKNPR